MSNGEIVNAPFAEFLRGLKMEQIWVESSSCNVNRSMLDGADGVEIEFGYAPKLLEATKKFASISVLFGARLLRKTREAETDEAGLLTVRFRVRYSTQQKMTAEIFDEFRKVTLLVNTVPFAREWIHDQSLRMGLDPILLPLALTHPAAAPPMDKRQMGSRRQKGGPQ